MCPRKRSISDHDILNAATTTLAGRGPHGVRLADVAAVSGLAPATLLQRFGSHGALMDAVGTALTRQIPLAFAGNAASHLGSIAGAFEQISASGHLTFFAARPAGAAGYSLELRKNVGFAIAAAIEAGELAPCDVATTARRLQLAFYGLATAAALEGNVQPVDAFVELVQSVLADSL